MSSGQPLLQQLNKLRDSKTVVVGVGNILKGDDGAGSIVCQRLQKVKTCADLIDVGTVPENYIQPIIKKNPQNLLIIDTIDFGASAGTIKIFKPEELDSIVISTHSLSPRLFVDMICKDINVNVYFIGIQPAQMMFGQSVSKQVELAIQQLSEVLAQIFPPED